MCNLSEGIARKNKAEGINEGRALGREEGIEIGEKNGFIRGRESGRIESFIELVKDGDLTIEKAANKLGKSVEEFKTLMNK
jgi:flagellar biosynthesis/type III secretory pathway protein FliH